MDFKTLKTKIFKKHKIANKKGLHVIDWTISMGIFLVAIVSIFIFLKPGSQPKYEGSTLISIVENNFLKETSWQIKKTPIFIKRLENDPSSGISGIAIVEINPNHDPNTNWKIQTITPQPPNFRFNILSTKIEIECNPGVCQAFPNPLVLIYKPDSNNRNKYPEISLDCSPTNQQYCNAFLGSTETLNGISQIKLNDLIAKDYSQVKTQWSFPSEREFRIFINNIELFNNTSQSLGNVFAKEIKIYTLDSLGNLMPITINIQVW